MRSDVGRQVGVGVGMLNARRMVKAMDWVVPGGCFFRDKVFGVVVAVPKHVVGDFI